MAEGVGVGRERREEGRVKPKAAAKGIPPKGKVSHWFTLLVKPPKLLLLLCHFPAMTGQQANECASKREQA